MKRLLALVLLALAEPSLAATRTVVLEVPSMTCATCPITVKKALERVDGVLDVKVTWQPKEAVVRYDDDKSTVESLVGATADIGYPSNPKQME